MLKADKSRRIMLRSAQATMVRQAETVRHKARFCCEMLGLRNATRRIKNEDGDNSPGKHDHERCFYRYFLALGRRVARQTNSQSTPRSRTQKTVSARTSGAGDRCGCSRDRKRRSFLKNDHWNNAGASRLLGQECDDTSARQSDGRMASLFLPLSFPRQR